LTNKLAEQQSPGICPDEQPRQAYIAEFAGRYRAALNAYFTRRVRNWAEAEDMTQEVLLRVARMEHPQGIRTAEAFLFQVARNLLRDRARAEKSRGERYAQVHERQDSAEELSPERVLQSRETLRSVLTALGRLNERTRDIFVLHRLENMKYHEIAKLYGISQSAVEKHMMKAIASVARHMNLP
jgi:RNA polymerase sigma-70 factor (ECF subfamily)